MKMVGAHGGGNIVDRKQEDNDAHDLMMWICVCMFVYVDGDGDGDGDVSDGCNVNIQGGDDVDEDVDSDDVKVEDGENGDVDTIVVDAHVVVDQVGIYD